MSAARMNSDFPNLRILDHPLIRQKLTLARDRCTPPIEFRRLLNEIAGLMTFEFTRDLPTEIVDVETPMEMTRGWRIAKPVTLVPILRAGIGMTDGILQLLPEARIAHIGIYRDEKSLQPVSYYRKFPPDIEAGPALLVDPMLATGGSASFAATELRTQGCTDIQMMCLVAAPEGVQKMLDDHPCVPIFTAALDRQLNDKGYILPGLGDAGDRIFGTQ